MIRQQIVENLKQCYDPEISINIYDLGLIYDIDIDHLPKVTITHTLTSAFCPAADDIISDIEAACGMVDGVDAVDVVQFQCDTFRSLGKNLSAQVKERNKGQPACSWYLEHGLAVDSWLYMPLAV